MMTDILNPWSELETDIIPPSPFSPHFPLPLQEVKVEIEDSETSASSYQDHGDLCRSSHNTYISLDSYEQISSPRSSFSQESLSPNTTNSDNSLNCSRYVNSATSVLRESPSPERFQYSPTERPEQSPTPSEFLNPLNSSGGMDSTNIRQLYQSIEDYRYNQSANSLPSSFGFHGFQQDFLTNEMNHSLYSHWTASTNALDRPDSRNTPEHLRTFRGEQLWETRVSRECVNCGSSTAHLWWQDGTGHFLCNSCSQTIKASSESTLLYKDIRKTPKRTATTKRTSMICTNCKADKTSLWRRNNLGETVCNACGLYYKLHKCNRPITMKKDSIQKRKRKPKPSEEKSKRHCKIVKEPKIENTVSVLNYAGDCLKEPLEPTYVNSSESHHTLQNLLQPTSSEYASSIRLLPPLYSSDGFRSSLSSPGPYFPSNYMSISPLSPIPSADSLPGVDIFQVRADSIPVSQPSVLTAISS